jgi:hypothetical protein
MHWNRSYLWNGLRPTSPAGHVSTSSDGIPIILVIKLSRRLNQTLNSPILHRISSYDELSKHVL